jgi:DNA-binding NarL/FixJ family response regulator
MINKVLIVEDHEMENLSLQRTLEDLHMDHTEHAYYCDEAFIKIKKAHQSGEPYDLLITDLHFETDLHHEQQLASGQALIAAGRQAQPDLKILVFSAERRPSIVESLYTTQQIDGYVRKARNDAKELKTAIDQIGHNQRFYPWWYVTHIKHKNAYDFTEYDIAIISLLAQGVRQTEMPARLKENNIHPSGLSALEKRLKLIRNAFGFTNNAQLIAHCKDTGIV